jgi:ubiquinone/menaquinone biosynthesis C-methylase UbiE
MASTCRSPAGASSASLTEVSSASIVNEVEFDRQASLIADQIPSLPEADRIPAACRGSGNPAALSWLAEGLRLDRSTTVVDLGAGLGGPSAWLCEHFGCRCINLEVAARAAAAQIFGTPTIRGCAEQAPIRSDSADVALLLGVLSVITHPELALAEALRIARRVGILDYCSTTGNAFTAGGSSFLPADELRRQVHTAGWRIVQFAPVTVPAPHTWTEAAESIDVQPAATEVEVIHAIESGQIAPVMLHAMRVPPASSERHRRQI